MSETTTQADTKNELVGLDIDPELDADSRERLVDAKVLLLFKSPFFGQLCSRMGVVNADAWCPTAATDGRNFYYNSRFIKMLSDDELVFLFGHEVLHCVYDHMGRTRDTQSDPQLSNIAQDFIVNGDLVDQRIGEKITTVPVLYDSKFRGWSSEEVYDYLVENQDKLDMQSLLDQLLDEHMDGDEDGDGDGDGVETDANGNKISKKKPKMSAAEKQKVRDAIKKALINAANAESSAGNLPAGIQRILSDLTEPKLNWRELIQQEIESTIKSDYSFMRPSRKSQHTGASLPGMIVDTTIDIVVAIDLSGSISEEMMRDFISEIKGIMELYPSFKMKLFTFDTAVYNDEDFDEMNADDLLDYPFQGGGGTDFMCCWEHMKEHDVQPKKFIMFTDGYPCGSWGDEHYCDTLFVIHGGGYGSSSPVAPWGMSCDYEEENVTEAA